jgi:uncharacterized membrane protein YcaP (DUF421 family)
MPHFGLPLNEMPQADTQDFVTEKMLMAWFSVDWQHLFVPSQSILETMIRGSCIYVAALAMLRLFRRQTGSLGPADLLVLLLIADAAQNGMAGEYRSITDGIILVATIIAWEYFLDWLSYRSRWIEEMLEGSPVLLIKDGRIQHDNLRDELITIDDLLAQLRRKGIEQPEQVKHCFLEGDGHVSVIAYRVDELPNDSEDIAPI